VEFSLCGFALIYIRAPWVYPMAIPTSGMGKI